MVFDAGLLTTRGFSDHLTEDMELQLELLLDGTSVDFAADAEVRAEMPTTLAAARTQNERWERGRSDLTRRFLPRLMAAAVVAKGRRRLALVDASADLLLPPFSVLAAGSLATGGLSLALDGRTRIGRWSRRLAAATVIIHGIHVLSGMRMVPCRRRCIGPWSRRRCSSPGRWCCGFEPCSRRTVSHGSAPLVTRSGDEATRRLSRYTRR